MVKGIVGIVVEVRFGRQEPSGEPSLRHVEKYTKERNGLTHQAIKYAKN